MNKRGIVPIVIIVLIIAVIFSLFNAIKINKKFALLMIPLILFLLLSNDRMEFMFTGKNYISNARGSFKLAGIPFIENEQIDIGFIPLTLIARFEQWSSVLVQMEGLDYIFGKGLGFSGIAREGMYVKILTDLGVVGIFIFFLYYYKYEIYFHTIDYNLNLIFIPCI